MTETPDDTQSRVFREADRADWDEHGLVEHPEASLDDVLDPHPGATREDYEDRGWDAGREGPKSLTQARAALAERIADPQAPDDEREAGAYDDIAEGEDT